MASGRYVRSRRPYLRLNYDTARASRRSGPRGMHDTAAEAGHAGAHEFVTTGSEIRDRSVSDLRARRGGGWRVLSGRGDSIVWGPARRPMSKRLVRRAAAPSLRLAEASVSRSPGRHARTSSWLSHKRPVNPVRQSVMGRPYSERVGCVSLVGHEAQSSLIWRVVSHRRTRDGSRAIYATSTVLSGRAVSVS
jgi:hypothetical protein